MQVPDLDNRDNIDRFVDYFYKRILADPVLAPIFVDVAEVDLAVHLPHIKDYWCKLLLGDKNYQRHTIMSTVSFTQSVRFTRRIFSAGWTCLWQLWMKIMWVNGQNGLSSSLKLLPKICRRRYF